MRTDLPKPFPNLNIEDDYNPGIRLYGKRFMKEQTLVGYLAEFLAVVTSNKKLDGKEIETPLPSLDTIKNWPQGESLQYKPPIKLNLKLFAFMGNTPMESKNKVHEEQYKRLIELMENNIIPTLDEKPEDVVECLEEFMRSFHGEGHNRTWCAQNFFPLTKGFITQETLWSDSKAKKTFDLTWEKTINNLNTYYDLKKRIFFNRGGEVLFLQLCNLFSQDNSIIKQFTKQLDPKRTGLFTDAECDLTELHYSLQEGMRDIETSYTGMLEELSDFIEMLDEETHYKVNERVTYTECEWCPQDSWQEGFLFAVEIKRLFEAVLDPVERVELLMTGCVLQVMRSLCAQSVRFTEKELNARRSTLGYAWLLSPPHNATRQQRIASRRCLQTNLGLIQKALRHNALFENAQKKPKNNSEEKMYKEADNRYGHKLFLSLGKKMSMIVPYTGPYARFVLTDSILRYLVLSLIRPGESCRYDVFLQRLYAHYGIAVEGSQLSDAAEWSGLRQNSSIQPVKGSWLTEMLLAGGFLTELSDDISIVNNTFI